MKKLMQFKTKTTISKEVLEACVCLCVMKLDCFITKDNTDMLPSILNYFMDLTIGQCENFQSVDDERDLSFDSLSSDKSVAIVSNQANKETDYFSQML